MEKGLKSSMKVKEGLIKTVRVDRIINYVTFTTIGVVNLASHRVFFPSLG